MTSLPLRSTGRVLRFAGALQLLVDAATQLRRLSSSDKRATRQKAAPKVQRHRHSIQPRYRSVAEPTTLIVSLLATGFYCVHCVFAQIVVRKIKSQGYAFEQKNQSTIHETLESLVVALH